MDRADMCADAERARQEIFQRLVDKGFFPAKQTSVNLYSSGSVLPFVSLSEDRPFPIRSDERSVGVDLHVRVVQGPSR